METLLDFHINSQPDETTCGPTCLHALYDYFGERIPLEQIIEEIPSLSTGGTLSVFLANHALRRGYKATVYTYDLKIFDPTWFVCSPKEMVERMREQARFKKKPRLSQATEGYIEFLELGGTLLMEDLRPRTIGDYLKRNLPILTGLSSTYLYQSPREYGPEDDWDDIRGEPQGHFVVLCGYDQRPRSVRIADPLQPNPAFDHHLYAVPVERVVTAILLGIVTMDANLLILEK